VHITGKSTDLMQNANSMQIDRKEIPEAKKGKKFGMKVDGPVREGDLVFRVTE